MSIKVSESLKNVDWILINLISPTILIYKSINLFEKITIIHNLGKLRKILAAKLKIAIIFIEDRVWERNILQLYWFDFT